MDKPVENAITVVEVHSPQDISGVNLDSKCETCYQSKCCQYNTVSIETPRSIRDFDNLIWHVSHINTHVFKDADGWYILLYNQCEHLASNGNCNIYDTRPFVCRDHSDDGCEKDYAINEGSELYFTKFEELDSYCTKRFKSWAKRFENL